MKQKPDKAVLMRIGIFQVDSVMPEFIDHFGNYPQMFESMFSDAALEHERLSFKNYDIQKGEFPKQIDECDAYVITGSKNSVYEALDWIRDLENQVIELHKARKKLVGICFGHQLIAHCLGGESGLSPHGWAVGVQTSEITCDVDSQMDWMEPAVEKFNLISSHKDQVLKLPDDARVYCESTACPVGGFSLGEHIITFQGHPEFSAAYSSELMNFRRDLLGESCYSLGQASLQKPLDRTLVARWILNFIAE